MNTMTPQKALELGLLKKVDKKITGLGDVVAKVAEPIKKTLMTYGPKQLQEYLSKCKCNERKKWLNDKFPIGKTTA